MQKYFTGIGRRKSAVAQTRIEVAKTNTLEINQNLSDIFPKLSSILQNVEKSFKITVVTRGGGIISQKDAIALGVARALIKFNEELKPVMRKNGWLTCDPRQKERKKPGLKGARRAPQWAKR